MTSTLLAKVLAAPNVKLFNATAVEDLIVKNNPAHGEACAAGGHFVSPDEVPHCGGEEVRSVCGV